MSEALKVSKITPKAPRIQTEIGSPPEKLRIQAHSLERAGSDLHCCTGELNAKSTAHTQEKRICLLNQRPKYAFENITNKPLVSQALLRSPLAVYRAQTAAFQQSKFTRRKMDPALGLFSSEL